MFRRLFIFLIAGIEQGILHNLRLFKDFLFHKMQILSLMNLALTKLCNSGGTFYFLTVFVINMDFFLGKA